MEGYKPIHTSEFPFTIKATRPVFPGDSRETIGGVKWRMEVNHSARKVKLTLDIPGAVAGEGTKPLEVECGNPLDDFLAVFHTQKQKVGHTFKSLGIIRIFDKNERTINKIEMEIGADFPTFDNMLKAYTNEFKYLPSHDAMSRQDFRNVNAVQDIVQLPPNAEPQGQPPNAEPQGQPPNAEPQGQPPNAEPQGQPPNAEPQDQLRQNEENPGGLPASYISRPWEDTKRRRLD